MNNGNQLQGGSLGGGSITINPSGMCSTCGGLIGEPGKTYGYAGKWCYCGFQNQPNTAPNNPIINVPNMIPLTSTDNSSYLYFLTEKILKLENKITELEKKIESK